MIKHGTASGRLDYLDALRAFVMSVGVVLHAGLLAPFWLPRSVSYFSGLFRMKLFIFLAGYFAALVMQRRGLDRTIRDRLIRFGVPILVFTILVNPLVNYIFYNMRVAPIGLLDFLSIPPAWNKHGFAWVGAPIYVTWHDQLWFIMVALLYCLLLGPLARFQRSRIVQSGIGYVTADGRSSSLGVGLLALVMAVAFLGGRTAHLLTTQQLLGTGPFNFIAMTTWIYLPYFVLGLAAFSNEKLFRLMHRVVWWQVALALVVLVLCEIGAKPATALVGRAGGEVLRYLGRGLFGFYLSVILLDLFRRVAHRPNRVLRFLSDASYTVYLFHIVLIAATHYALEAWGVDRRLNYFISIVVVYPLCLAIHIWIVDRSPITRLLLNGKPLPHKGSAKARAAA